MHHPALKAEDLRRGAGPELECGAVAAAAQSSDQKPRSERVAGARASTTVVGRASTCSAPPGENSVAP